MAIWVKCDRNEMNIRTQIERGGEVANVQGDIRSSLTEYVKHKLQCFSRIKTKFTNVVISAQFF